MKRGRVIRLKPKISVIIPCFNYGHFIEETVDSVLSQTFTDYEIIIVDDGSTDETPDLLGSIRDDLYPDRRLRREVARLTNDQLAAHDSWAASVIRGNTDRHYAEHAVDLDARIRLP